LTPTASSEITALIRAWSDGDQSALERLTPLVYNELRRMARHYMRNQRAGHTLQTTALVHEVYVHLMDAKRTGWRDRAHFFAVSAQIMRRILIDAARTRASQKRGGGIEHVNHSTPVDLDEMRARMHLNPCRLVGRRRPQRKRFKARRTMQVCFGQRGPLVRQHGLVADQVDVPDPALLTRRHRQLSTGMARTHDQKIFAFTHAVP